MGQYYNIIIKEKGKDKIVAYDRTMDFGDYVGAKLMEHSWYNNEMVNAICEKLYYKPSQIAWVGDYADENDLYYAAWGKGNKEPTYLTLKSTRFMLNGKYLVNHTRKEIVDCWDYLCKCIRNQEDNWVIHPLPLLVALGNGRGGGDYRGSNYNYVGLWAWDEIEIVEYELYNEFVNDKGYKVLDLYFKE